MMSPRSPRHGPGSPTAGPLGVMRVLRGLGGRMFGPITAACVLDDCAIGNVPTGRSLGQKVDERFPRWGVEGEWEGLLMGIGFLFEVDENVLKSIVVMVV